jgi:spore coat protein U-like protein
MTAHVALAATVTQNITVSLTLQAECKIQATTNLSFGTNGVIDTNRDATSTMDIQCTDTTPYTISLNAGTGSGASTTVRKLTSGGNTADYALYRNAARNQIWGNSIGTDTVAATGNGTIQQHTIYGRMPPQDTPAPGAYSDTVQITVTY